MTKTRVRLLLHFLMGCLWMVVALRVLGRVDHFVLILPVSGVQIGLLLPHCGSSWRYRAGAFAAAAAGVVAGGWLVGMPVTLGLCIAGLTCIDMAIGCFVLGESVKTFEDLKSGTNFVRFGVTATIAPFVTGLLGALPVSHVLRGSFLRTLAGSTLADSIGIAFLLPCVLFLTNGEYRSPKRLHPHFRRHWLPFAVFAVVILFIFRQDFGPFLFLVFPPTIFTLWAWGLEGALLTSLTVIGVGWFGTEAGHGPLWLMPGVTAETRLLLLQVFIWIFLATALPVGSLLDERRRAERTAKEAKIIYQTLLQNTGDMMVLSSMDGTRRYVTPAVLQLTGWTQEEYLQLDRLKTIHPEDQHLAGLILESLAGGKREHSMRYRVMQKDGGSRWVEASVRAYGDAHTDIAGYVGTLRDISKFKETEDEWAEERATLAMEQQRVERLASTDPLTALLNRRGFDKAMSQRKTRTMKPPVSLLMIDVDYFKLYNDSLGHQAGDDCLQRLARLFAAGAAAEQRIVARLGGEEFALLLPGTTQQQAAVVADELLHNVRAARIAHLASPLGYVTVSIGIATSREQEPLDTMALMQQADTALYASKRAGRNMASAEKPQPAFASA